MRIEKIATSFISAFEQGDYKRMESLLALDLISHVTNATAGMDRLQGRDIYMKRICALHAEVIKPTIEITQMAKISENQVLVMVRVNAQNNDKILHNYVAHLITIKNEKIIEMWMVEALPEYSDTFWK